MAFTFKKTLENVAVSNMASCLDKLITMKHRSEIPYLMQLAPRTFALSSKRLGKITFSSFSL
jgi:hypothetical protein